MRFVHQESTEQAAANRSALPHEASFAGHRQRLTELIAEVTPAGTGQRLCVLGAGNGYDLELPSLAERFDEIHLVDLDADALAGARLRADAVTRARLFCHAPVDLSGLLEDLPRWAELRLTPQDLMDHPRRTAQHLVHVLGSRPFDTVVSACMLSQMQLSVLRGLGERHQLFEAVRYTLNLSHMRTLLELTAPGGRALFVTDVSSEQLTALPPSLADADALELLSASSRAGRVFDFAEPHALRAQFLQDPSLVALGRISKPGAAWIWQNGPAQRFLVYALELTRVA